MLQALRGTLTIITTFQDSKVLERIYPDEPSYRNLFVGIFVYLLKKGIASYQLQTYLRYRFEV